MRGHPLKSTHPVLSLGEMRLKETLTLRLSGGPTAPARARTALRSLDRTVADLRDDVDLLVSELVTNSVQHARVGPDDSIEMKLAVDERQIRVEIADHGPGFEPRPRGPDRHSRSGWGLYLVDQLSDRWGVSRTDGTAAWFEIDRDIDAQPPAR